ncbi:hypothetical protein MSPP1_001112 [Malassezia sp. CBS 17886]|nr:hypothetical protein MSPP1_001112 [Malassezia sp. CBS 17886]
MPSTRVRHSLADSAAKPLRRAQPKGDDDSGSDVEEISSTAVRRQERQRASEARQQRTATHRTQREKVQRRTASQPERASRKDKKAKQARAAPGEAATQRPPHGDADTLAPADDDAGGAAPHDAAPTRLDPALFAAAFARRGDAAAREVVRSAKREPRTRPVRKTPEGGYVARVKGERTTVQTLESPEEPAGNDDVPLSYTRLDPARARPSAAARAFKKRKLGLRKDDVRATVLTPSASALRQHARAEARETRADADDPLGLGDPETTKKSRRRRSRPLFAGLQARGSGARVTGECTVCVADM